jgi:hypothetical protein
MRNVGDVRFATLCRIFSWPRLFGLLTSGVLCFAVLAWGAAHVTGIPLILAWQWVINTANCRACALQSSTRAARGAMPSAAGGAFANFDAPGAGTGIMEGTIGMSVNTAGEVAGVYIATGPVYHGFLRSSNGTITPIDAPAAGTGKNQGTFPISMNDAGEIAGLYADSNSVGHGFLRETNGTVTPIDVSGAGTTANRGTAAISINAGGDIAGVYTTGTYQGTSVRHGFIRFTDGSIKTFDVPEAGAGYAQGTVPLSINSSQVITGTYIDASGKYHGFIRDSAGALTSIDAPGASGTIPLSIDSAGDISGTYSDSKGIDHGFLLPSGGTMITFTAPGASTTPPGSGKGIKFDGTLALSVNTGVVAGFYTGSNATGHVFVRSEGVDGTITAPLDDSEAGTGPMQGTAAVSINESGLVTGTYVDASSALHGFLYTPSSAVSLSPTSLGFGNQVLDTASAAKIVTVTNTGSATLDINKIATSAGFAVSAKTCGSTLAPGEKCDVNVTFEPTKLGADSGTLSLTDGAPNSPQAVPLSGTGIAPVTLVPATATYAEQKVGTTSAAKKFTLTNNQSMALTGIAISTTGNFAISATTCTTNLASEKNCSISVTFKPTATGTRTGKLTVKDSAKGNPQTSSLTGTGD